MSAEAVFLAREFPVGRFKVTFSCRRPEAGAVMAMTCEWEPDLPDRMTSSEQRAYAQARAAFLAEMAQHLGGSIALVTV